MPRLHLMPHLTYDQLTDRFRRCRDGRQKARWQALWLLRRPQGPLSAAQAAAVVGLTADAVRKLVHRYNAAGPAAVERNAGGHGRAPRLSPAQQQQLKGELLGRAPDGGLWTGPKVAAFARARFGVQVRDQTGWVWLRKLGFRLKVPRPRHPRAASADEQRRWQRRPRPVRR